MHAILACVGSTARRKSFIVAWMKESTREEGREYYGGGSERKFTMSICPTRQSDAYMSRTVLFGCFQCASSLSHSLVNGAGFSEMISSLQMELNRCQRDFLQHPFINY